MHAMYYKLFPLLQKKHFTTLDIVLSDEDFPSLVFLCDVEGTSQLSEVCDIKEAVDMNVYRLNGEKTIAWLQKKVEGLVSRLEEMPHINVGMVAKVVSFVPSKQNKSSAKSQSKWCFTRGTCVV